jgi:hypothetical protein
MIHLVPVRSEDISRRLAGAFLEPYSFEGLEKGKERVQAGREIVKREP